MLFLSQSPKRPHFMCSGTQLIFSFLREQLVEYSVNQNMSCLAP